MEIGCALVPDIVMRACDCVVTEIPLPILTVVPAAIVRVVPDLTITFSVIVTFPDQVVSWVTKRVAVAALELLQK